MWLAYEYRDAWSNLYVQCDEDTKTMLDARLDQLKEKGNRTGRTISAPLDDGIFELRSKKALMLFSLGSVLNRHHRRTRLYPKLQRIGRNYTNRTSRKRTRRISNHKKQKIKKIRKKSVEMRF